MVWLIVWLLGIVAWIVSSTLFGLLAFASGFLLVVISFGVLVYYVLAPQNRWFTFVKETTVKTVVRAHKFEKGLIQWEGRTLDRTSKTEWNVIQGREKHFFGGLRFYGWWPFFDILVYKFRWTGVNEKGEVQSHEEEWLDFIFLGDDVYWAKVEKAEDLNLLALDVELIMTIYIENPRKALFDIQNWLEATINRIKPAVRDAISHDEFEQWIGKKEALSKRIREALDETKVLNELRKRYGVVVRKIEIKDINPSDPNHISETLKRYIAEQEEKRILVEARAEAGRLTKVAEGEAARVEKVYQRIKDFGDLGKLVRTLEALEKSPLAASMTVQAVPGLQEALRGVFGKPPESATSEEIAGLRETIEKFIETQGGNN